MSEGCTTVSFLESYSTPLRNRSEGVVIYVMAIKVVAFNFRSFTDNWSLSDQLLNSSMNGYHGIAFVLNDASLVPVYQTGIEDQRHLQGYLYEGPHIGILYLLV